MYTIRMFDTFAKKCFFVFAEYLERLARSIVKICLLLCLADGKHTSSKQTNLHAK